MKIGNNIFLLYGFAGLILASCGHDHKKQEQEIPEISVAEPLVENVEITETYPATIESADRADVVARVSGQILAKHYKDGDFVQKGQSLFTIESTVYDETLREARARLESANASLKYATHHYEALKKAYASHAVSEMEVMQALSQKEAAEADVMEARSQIKTAQTRVGYCTVPAPVSGKISSSTLDVGNYVNGEGSPVTLATIYNSDNLSVHFSIPEQQYASIREADGGFGNEVYRKVRVCLTNDENLAADSPQYIADIVYESPAVEATTGNIKLKGKIINVDSRLKPGMYGIVELPVADEAQGILIKDASISTDQRGKYVYTVDKSDNIVYTPIKVGQIYQDSLRLVTSGLKPGDRYVTDAIMKVRSGMKVHPVLVSNKSGVSAKSAQTAVKTSSK